MKTIYTAIKPLRKYGRLELENDIMRVNSQLTPELTPQPCPSPVPSAVRALRLACRESSPGPRLAVMRVIQRMTQRQRSTCSRLASL